MRLEYGLVENALDSLRESMAYYTEGDETHNVNQYKFSILLAAHCAELLLKEILRRNHPALLFENICIVTSAETKSLTQIGYIRPLFQTPMPTISGFCALIVQRDIQKRSSS